VVWRLIRGAPSCGSGQNDSFNDCPSVSPLQAKKMHKTCPFCDSTRIGFGLIYLVMWRLIIVTCLCALPAFGDQKPVVSLAGIGTAGVKLTTAMGQFSFSYPLEAAGDVKGLTVAVDDFHGPNDSVVRPEVTLDGKPANVAIDFKQSERPLLRIAGTFPYAGDYASNIVITQGESRQASIPVVVTRQWNAIGVQVELVDTARATTVLPGSAADATIRFTVKESGGKPLTIYTPKVTELALKRGDKQKVQARYAKAELKDPKSSLAFEPQESREYVVVISGLQDPGEYSGVITVGSPDATAMETAFTLFVKNGWFTAFLFIFAGVGASYLIRRWTGETRPRLDLQRRVSNLSDDLGAVEKTATPLPFGSGRVFTALREKLAKVGRDIEQGASGDRTPELDELNVKISKLPPWLTLGNELAAVDPQATVQKQIDDWQNLGDSYFLEPGAKVDVLDKAIGDIRTAMKEAVKAAMVKRIDDFTAVVSAYKTAHPNVKMDGVERLAGSAKTKAGAGDPAGAGADLRLAQSEYAKQAASDLNTVLSQASPPAGFTPQAWADLATRLRAKIPDVSREPDPAKAIALFDDVNGEFLREIISHLEELAQELAPKVDSNPHLAPEAKKELQTTLGEAVAGLKGARTSLDSGDGNAAMASYNSAAGKIKGVIDKLAATGVSPLGPGRQIGSFIADFFAPPQPLVLHEARAVSDRVERKVSTGEKLTEKIRQYDLLLNLGLLIIATVLGLKLLWADSATWGGAGDYAVAFLWGLGLQQVGGAGFEGLPAVLKKVTG